MKPGGITNALRGITGEFEITRVVGGIGSVIYIIGANGFVAWNMAEGRPFDLTAYCVAFPSGLGVVIAAIAGSASVKDRNVAAAKATEAKTKADSANGSHAEAEGAEQAAKAATDEAAVIRDGKP